jgi:predicted O-methyltransferase YrrM
MIDTWLGWLESRLARPADKPQQDLLVKDALPILRRELEDFGREHDARAERHGDRMLNITPETGEFLALLVRALQTRRVLEIGTSNGYSTLWLAEAAKQIGGQVVTVEISPDKAELARRNLERAGLSRWVRQEVTDAGPFLSRQSAASFDLIFLDAKRAQYTGWWSWIQEVLAPGGLLIVDNAVSHAAELEGFRDQVRAAGWQSTVVPVGKGEYLALKGGSRTRLEEAPGRPQGNSYYPRM